MAKMQYCGTGRRKSSVARVRLIPGKGSITINKRSERLLRHGDPQERSQKTPGSCELGGKIRRGRHRPRRRVHRTGRRPAPRHLQSPVRSGSRESRRPEGSGFPDPGPQNDGAEKVRLKESQKSFPVQQEIDPQAPTDMQTSRSALRDLY